MKKQSLGYSMCIPVALASALGCAADPAQLSQSAIRGDPGADGGAPSEDDRPPPDDSLPPSEDPPPEEPVGCPTVECGPYDARSAPDGDATCDHILGFAFDGRGCIGLTGCACEGADCDRLFESLDDCESAWAVCADLPPHCLTEPTPPPTSGDPSDPIICPEVECSASDARGTGACERVLGYAFDGRGCVGLSGCECEGASCDRLFDTLEDCESAWAVCADLPPGCLGST